MNDEQRSRLLRYLKPSAAPQESLLGGLSLLALISPWGLAGILAWMSSRTPLALGWVLLGLLLGLLMVPLTGTLWLQRWSPELFESQGGGIGYLVSTLPFLAYTGAIMGAWSIAIGHWLWIDQDDFILWQSLGLVSTIGTGGLLLLAAISPFIHRWGRGKGDRRGEVEIPRIAALAIANGLLSPLIVHGGLWSLLGLIRH